MLPPAPAAPMLHDDPLPDDGEVPASPPDERAKPDLVTARRDPGVDRRIARRDEDTAETGRRALRPRRLVDDDAVDGQVRARHVGVRREGRIGLELRRDGDLLEHLRGRVAGSDRVLLDVRTFDGHRTERRRQRGGGGDHDVARCARRLVLVVGDRRLQRLRGAERVPGQRVRLAGRDRRRRLHDPAAGHVRVGRHRERDVDPRPSSGATRAWPTSADSTHRASSRSRRRSRSRWPALRSRARRRRRSRVARCTQRPCAARRTRRGRTRGSRPKSEESNA